MTIPSRYLSYTQEADRSLAILKKSVYRAHEKIELLIKLEHLKEPQRELEWIQP